MYNVTTGEYCETTPRNYSFAEYLGYTGEQEASNGSVSINDWWFGGYAAGVAIDDSTGQDVMQFHDGELVTSVPYTRFIVSRGTNIGTWFEYYAKKFYDQYGSWPILRLLRTNNTDTQYIEWNHSNPTTLVVKTDVTFVWSSVLQWNDSFNDNYTDDRKYNSMYSQVFLKASVKEQLPTTVLCFNGSVRLDESSGNVVTQISYATFSVIMLSGPATLISAAGTFLSSKGQRAYYKAYDGPCFAFQVHGQWDGPITFAPLTSNNRTAVLTPYNMDYICEGNILGSEGVIGPIHEIYWGYAAGYHYPSSYGYAVTTDLTTVGDGTHPNAYWAEYVIENSEFQITFVRTNIYAYLLDTTPPSPQPPDTPDVDPDNPPDPDDPPAPQPPDNPDPYYDPTSDPDSPDYDPTKDPSSPDYDPDVPHPPFTPPSTEGGGDDPQPQPPQDEIPAPETPPSYVTTNALFTLYNPSGADLTNLANFLWSPAWSIDTFKKIFANPLDCILGLMVMPYLAVDVGTKNMNVGNIDTGVAMRYFTKQFYDFDCGDFTIEEFYRAYLDYAPYTKISIFLPYIGDQQLNTDEVMGKTLNVKYRFDLATGDCVAFVSVDGSVLYSFSGNCAARLPLSSNNYGGLLPSVTGAIVAAGSMAAGVPALGAASALAVSSMKQDIRHTGSISGSAGLMGVQTPYLIITRPRQALPIGQNSFMGYPSFITESLGGLTGYTEVESCHLEHIPCTDEELREIENLLKGGVLF